MVSSSLLVTFPRRLKQKNSGGGDGRHQVSKNFFGSSRFIIIYILRPKRKRSLYNQVNSQKNIRPKAIHFLSSV